MQNLHLLTQIEQYEKTAQGEIGPEVLRRATSGPVPVDFCEYTYGD